MSGPGHKEELIASMGTTRLITLLAVYIALPMTQAQQGLGKRVGQSERSRGEKGGHVR